MDIDTDEILRKRYWVRQNFEWLMSEVAFHREMKLFFKNTRIKLWNLDDSEGRANPYETTE
jgi:hypothetical protein